MTAPSRFRGVERWKIAKSCADKRRFCDEITARVGAQIQCERDLKRAMWVYHCDFCKGWHITNKPHSLRSRVTALSAYPVYDESTAPRVSRAK